MRAYAGVVTPVPEPEHDAGLLVPPAPPLRFSIDASGAGVLAAQASMTRGRASSVGSTAGGCTPSSRASLAMPLLSEESPLPGAEAPLPGRPASNDPASLPSPPGGPALAAVRVISPVSLSSPQVSSAALPLFDVPHGPTPPAAPAAGGAGAGPSAALPRPSLTADVALANAFTSGLYAQRPDPAGARAATKAAAASRMSDVGRRGARGAGPGPSQIAEVVRDARGNGLRTTAGAPQSREAMQGAERHAAQEGAGRGVGDMGLDGEACVDCAGLSGQGAFGQQQQQQQQQEEVHAQDHDTPSALGRAQTADLLSYPSGASLRRSDAASHASSLAAASCALG